MEESMATLIRRPTGIYYIVTSVKGKRTWISTRTKDRHAAFRAIASVPGGEDRPERPTLSSSISEYITHVRRTFRSKTHEVYQLALDHFLKFTGDLPLDSITPRHIDLFKAFRMSKVSPATVNLELRALKTFFNCLKRWEILLKSPADGVGSVRLSQRTPAFLTIEQLQRLVGSLKDDWLRRIVLFAAMTGARLGEVLNLTWDRVDLEGRVVLIESNLNFRVKCGKIRAIPLNETALQLLQSMAVRDGLVFRGKRGGKANPNHVSGHFRRAVRNMGLDERLHFHSLRHTFASLLVQAGISLYQVQQLLGHSSSRVTEMYAHLQSPKLHHVVELLQLPARP
jgi:integrase